MDSSQTERPSQAPRPDPTPVHRVDSATALEAELNRHLNRSRRQGDPLAMLWIEVELLARVGPAPGGSPRQAVALALGARLQHRVRRTDLVFQVGETGFAVLLDTDRAGAELVERRLFEQLRGPYGMDKGMAHVHLSLGLAVASEARARGCSLLQCARLDIYVRPPQSPSRDVVTA